MVTWWGRCLGGSEVKDSNSSLSCVGVGVAKCLGGGACCGSYGV